MTLFRSLNRAFERGGFSAENLLGPVCQHPLNARLTFKITSPEVAHHLAGPNHWGERNGRSKPAGLFFKERCGDDTDRPLGAEAEREYSREGVCSQPRVPRFRCDSPPRRRHRHQEDGRESSALLRSELLRDPERPRARGEEACEAIRLLELGERLRRTEEATRYRGVALRPASSLRLLESDRRAAGDELLQEPRAARRDYAELAPLRRARPTHESHHSFHSGLPLEPAAHPLQRREGHDGSFARSELR